MSNATVIIIVVIAVFFCGFEIFSFVRTIVNNKKKKKEMQKDDNTPSDNIE